MAWLLCLPVGQVRVRTVAPKLGQHNAEVFGRIGVTGLEIKAAGKARLIDSGERTQIGAQLFAVGPRQKVFDGGVRVPPYRNGRDEKGPSG
jgi:hypothetical protein